MYYITIYDTGKYFFATKRENIFIFLAIFPKFAKICVGEPVTFVMGLGKGGEKAGVRLPVFLFLKNLKTKLHTDTKKDE